MPSVDSEPINFPKSFTKYFTGLKNFATALSFLTTSSNCFPDFSAAYLTTSLILFSCASVIPFPFTLNFLAPISFKAHN